MRNSYAKNLIIDWFVDFNLDSLSEKTVTTEYGDFPTEIKLISLRELISETLASEWKKSIR